MNADAKIGNSYFGTGFSVRQGSKNPISTYGYDYDWGIPYFNIESKTTEDALKMRYIDNGYKYFLTNEFMIFICQIERSGSELYSPTSVDFWITSLTGEDETEEHVLKNGLFSGGQVGYSYEGDTGLLMVVFDSSNFIGCDSLTKFRVRLNYGSNQDTYIQKIYTTDGSNADMQGAGKTSSASSTRFYNMCWVNNNISDSSVMTGPVLVQNWYEGSLQTYGYRGTVSQALNKEHLDSRFFSNNLISFLQPSGYLSYTNRYPNRIILIDIDDNKYYTDAYDEAKERVKYTYVQGNILKPIKQIRLEFKENGFAGVKEFVIAEKNEAPFLLTPIGYYSPTFTVQDNIANVLTQVNNTNFELQSQIDFSIAYDNYCPYIFPDAPEFEFIFGDNSSIKLDNDDIDCRKEGNGYRFTLKDNFKQTIARSNSQIATSGQLVKAGNYFLKITNLKSRFYTDNLSGNSFVSVQFSRDNISIEEKEEYVTLESFPNQIQYKKDSTIYDVVGNVIIPGERVKIFEYPNNLLVYSTKATNDTYNIYTGTLDSASYQIKYSFDNVHYNTASNAIGYNTENDGTNIAHIISWEKLAETIFGSNYSEKEETVSIKIVPAITVKFVQNEEQKNTQIFPYEANIHLGIIKNEIVFDEVRVEGTNLIIRFNNNGGDRNRFYSANDFVQSRTQKKQYFSLSREGAKESLELDLTCEGSTLSFSIKELKDPVTEQVVVTPEQLIVLFEENKNNIASLDLLEKFDTNGEAGAVSKFFVDNRGKTIQIKGDYCYTYTTEGGVVSKRVLSSIKTFEFSISSGLSVLGLREGGVIINPRANDPLLESGTAEKIYLRTVKPEATSNDYAGKGIRIIAEDPTGEQVDECSIEYRKNANEKGFYLNGIKLPDLDTVKNNVNSLENTVNDSNTGLVKKVGDLETTVGDSSSGLVKSVGQNTTNISSLLGLECFVLEAFAKKSDGSDQYFSDGDSYTGSIVFSNNKIKANSVCMPFLSVQQRSTQDGENSEHIKLLRENLRLCSTGFSQTTGSASLGYAIYLPTETFYNYNVRLKGRLLVINLPSVLTSSVNLNSLSMDGEEIINTILSDETIQTTIDEENLTTP